MHILAYVSIFLMGGVAATVIIRLLLFHFWGPTFRRPEDDQYLKRIAEILNQPG